MTGMDHNTGAEISAFEDVVQSCADILWTPIGSRIARREYGSRLPDMVDQPANQANRTLMYASVATALRRWEPRINVKRVAVASLDAANGRFAVQLEATLVDDAAAQSYRLTIAGGTSS
jgi:phage baseplate assembly protein W